MTAIDRKHGKTTLPEEMVQAFARPDHDALLRKACEGRFRQFHAMLIRDVMRLSKEKANPKVADLKAQEVLRRMYPKEGSNA